MFDENMMCMKKIYLINLIFISLQISAQVPSIQESLTFGGTSFDQAQSGIELLNGDFIIAGQTQSSDYDIAHLLGIMDIWLVKTTGEGISYKNRVYGGTSDEWAVKVLKSDQGYFILGTTSSNDLNVRGNHGEYDVWAVRINDEGEILRARCLGGSANEFANDAIATSDGGYLITATTYSNDGDVNYNHGNADVWVVKVNDNAEIEWQKSLGGAGAEMDAKVLETEDGNFIIASSGNSTDGSLHLQHGGSDIWVVELSSTGNILRQQCYGGTGNEFAGAIAMQAGNILGLTATTSSNDGDVSGQHGGADVWFLQLNEKGKIISEHCFGGTDSDQARDIKSIEGGGWLLAAATYSQDGDVSGNHGRYDAWLIELNTVGNLVWQQCYGGTKDDLPNALLLTQDKHWAICGYSHSKSDDLTKNYGESDVWVFQLYKNHNQNKKNISVFSPDITTAEY